MERVQKLIAAAGICSRRAAEELITAGRVTVNGAVCALGDRADAEKDEIRVDELEGFPIGLWVNFSEENKFVTGQNEIIFMLQPLDILDYIEEHFPEAKEEIKKKIQYSSDDQNPILLVTRLR